MTRSGLLIAALVVATVSAEGAPRGLHVTVRDAAGVSRALEPEPAQNVAARVRALLDDCSFHSPEDPTIFAGVDAGETWQRTAGEPHVYVRFAASFQPRRREGTSRLMVTEAVVPLTTAGALHWPVRSGSEMGLLTKCSGVRGLELVCAPELRDHVPPASRQQCRLIRR